MSKSILCTVSKQVILEYANNNSNSTNTDNDNDNNNNNSNNNNNKGKGFSVVVKCNNSNNKLTDTFKIYDQLYIPDSFHYSEDNPNWCKKTTEVIKIVDKDNNVKADIDAFVLGPRSKLNGELKKFLLNFNCCGGKRH